MNAVTHLCAVISFIVIAALSAFVAWDIVNHGKMTDDEDYWTPRSSWAVVAALVILLIGLAPGAGL